MMSLLYLARAAGKAVSLQFTQKNRLALPAISFASQTTQK
jgi:hypothetical protein